MELGNYSGWLWAAVDVLFVIILAVALIYGTLQWRRFRPRPEQARQRDQATRELFRTSDRQK
jgi:heme exporter protein D